METIAISTGIPDHILWCHILSESKDRIEFEVINGCWTGVLENGIAAADAYPEDKMAAKIVWRGTVASEVAYSYNKAIPWILDRIKEIKPKKQVDVPAAAILLIPALIGIYNASKQKKVKNVHDICHVRA